MEESKLKSEKSQKIQKKIVKRQGKIQKKCELKGENMKNTEER